MIILYMNIYSLYDSHNDEIYAELQTTQVIVISMDINRLYNSTVILYKQINGLTQC
jgi:hypothetical protein